MNFSSCFNVMKRYRVKSLRYQDLEEFIIYLSADCKVCAYSKAFSFLRDAYGSYYFYIISILEE